MKIDPSSDVIDSSDVIARIEELEAEEALTFEERGELAALKDLADQAEHYGDWSYGAPLYADSYFVQHITDTIDECYEDVPPSPGSWRDKNGKGKSDRWPYRHIKVDYEAAAEEAKADYVEVTYCDMVFWMRG